MSSVNSDMGLQLHSLSACSRLLDIPEIFEVIVEQLYASGRGAGSVASLAITCRSVHAIALSVLWRCMDSLVPFFRTLPQDSWSEIHRDEKTKVFSLNPVLSFDLTRFNYYSTHVRRFHWEDKGDFDYATLQYFFICVPNTFCLFPQVRSITLQGDWIDHIPHPKTLVGPLISHVRLNIVSTNSIHDVEQFLAGVKQVCSDPRSLRLDVSVNTSRIDSGSLRIFKALRLQVMSLKFTGPGFQELESLNINVHNFDEDTMDLLHSIKSPRFTELVLKLKHQPPEIVLFLHFEVLRRLHPALCQLVVQMREPEAKETRSSSTVTIDTLRPLLSLSHLTILRIDGGYLSLDLDAIKTLARSLPRLKSLHLVPGSVFGTDVPLGALFYLAYHCTELESVGLSVDAREDQLPYVPVYWQSQSRVEALWLVNSPIDDTASNGTSVSALLIHLFPKLRYVNHRLRDFTVHPKESRWDHGWSLVGDFVTDHFIKTERLLEETTGNSEPS